LGVQAGTGGSARAALALAATALTCGLLAGCGSPARGAASQSLTLYSGQHPQTTDQLVAAFEKRTGITVNVRSDDEDVLADQIATEASRSPADVFYTENSPPLAFLQEKGLLAGVRPAALAATPAKYNSPRGDWVGVSARVSVLIYNPARIARSQLPTSVMQLAAPRYDGQLALAPGETDFQPIITSVLRSHGRAATLRWLAGLKANEKGHTYPDSETIASDVNRGLAGFGVINQYYWYRMRSQVGAAGMHARLAFFAPRDPGYVIDVCGAAVLRSSTHRAAAQKFVAFLVSRQAQEIIGGHSASYEYPVAAGVTTAAPQTPLRDLRPDPISVGALGDGSAAIALLVQAGLL
jgi:iron(III) transport system substrate-binding protein